jgi:hypothetical protein
MRTFFQLQWEAAQTHMSGTAASGSSSLPEGAGEGGMPPSEHQARAGHQSSSREAMAGHRRAQGAGRGADRPRMVALVLSLLWRVWCGVLDAIQVHQLWPMLRQSR